MSDLVNPRWPDGLEGSAGTDTRNVVDHFKYWNDEAIRAALDEDRTELHIVLENFAHDFNIGTAIRNANAFTVGEVWVTGRRKYDRRGTVGTHHYEHLHHAGSTEEVIEAHRALGYRIVVVDNVDGAEDLEGHTWVPRTLLVFGQESIGVSPRALELADDVVYIAQRGSVRSLNVGAASAIMIHDYTRQVHPSV